MTKDQDNDGDIKPVLPKEEIAENLGLTLNEIVKALHRQFKKQFHEFMGGKELTVPQIFLLRDLVKKGPTSISDLAANLNLANSTVSGIVDRLERDGFVKRVRGSDRRVVYVQLTERAACFKEQVPQFQQKFLNELLKGVDEESQAEMYASFKKIHDLILRFEERDNN